MPAFLVLAALCGCGGQQLRQGEPNFNTGILLPYPNESSRDATALGLKPAAIPTQCVDGSATSSNVADCIYAVKSIIDDQYREYRITLHHFADQGNAAADISVLGLTGAATGPVSIVAKTVLSGLATFVGGTKTVLNQDLLYKQTIEIVISQMDSDRDQQFTLMLKQMSGTYSIEQAKDDLLLYFAAGTWDHAVTSLQSKVAANQANCKAETDATKISSSKRTAGTPTTTSTNCPTAPSAAQQGANAVTPASASIGSVFDAASGVGTYKVVKAASSPSDTIQVSYAPDGKTYVTLPAMPFTSFVLVIKAPSAPQATNQ